MFKIILTITIILLGLGFAPYKFPRNPDKLADNELIVDHEESTCSSDLYVVRGYMNIPQDLKSYFPNAPTDFSIDNTGKSMFDPVNDNQNNWSLISDNQFIISGKVTGFDTSYYKLCGTYIPKFKIDAWAPTNYHPNFLSFSVPVFFTYFLALFASSLTTIVLFFIRTPWRRKI